MSSAGGGRSGPQSPDDFRERELELMKMLAGFGQTLHALVHLMLGMNDAIGFLLAGPASELTLSDQKAEVAEREELFRNVQRELERLGFGPRTRAVDD